MINYKQLYYFWNVAKSGGVIHAAKRLNITPQTISHQIGELETSLGTLLFRRVGKRMELTQAGEIALSRADEIFQIGNEIELLVKDQAVSGGFVFRVGVVDTVPKAMAYQLLSATLNLPEPIRLICHNDKPDRLFGELAIHRLDLVIADQSLPRELGVKAYNHELGQSGVTFCASPSLAARLTGSFPDCLQNAPMLMPSEGTSLRAVISHWLSKNQLRPDIVAEFADTGLLKAFGHTGLGIFPVPSVMADEVMKQYGVVTIGNYEGEMIKFFAISHERRLKHPAVLAVRNLARTNLFQSGLKFSSTKKQPGFS
ncbi:transcriptional regulator, LysR family [Desulfobotulus alkaliphilus]|uniref:Transcriptional regulator, LysR family n=1 Tax=Desulfobotulus alkaliphilus TaxID=622671 RepID=A0A562S7Q3_9BACT|nr:LysR family transcriptional regulator [Desulfobotulus alkaliphilus]TWI77447.1 transcriptional regulator, LysR family [Desulfobotulus alkaliphilus]